MDYAIFVEHVRRDGARLADVARADLSVDIATCPGWTMRDLVRHVAEVYEHKIACTALGRAPDPWPPEWPADRDPVEWLADAHERLLEMFERSEPSTPSATWWPSDQTVGFWARRMAHETAIHRTDAELATMTVTPIEADLAVDGVDEILVVMLAGDWSDEPDDGVTGQRVAIATGGRSWRVELEPDSVVVVPDGDEIDAAVGGEPQDVVRWLWGRSPDERVTRSGDAATLQLLRSRLVRATQ
ncbi:MAG TPA: maleylpyruvate isomerase family mycothiol-dependent enzyme [Actinomycetota bacterium]|nr:maleylpyruvate isomerase family mycothiol-dependent enzyme [Actinomycetota bacterium]